MRLTPSGTAALPLALVLLSMLGLVIVPVAVQQRATQLWTEISDYSDPARALVSDVQAAVALEMGGIRSFLITDDPRYPGMYREAHARRSRAYAELVALTDTLGGTPAGEARRLGQLLAAADPPVEDLLTHKTSSADFIAQLSMQQTRFQQVMDSAVRLDAAIRDRIADRRQALHRLDRL